MNNPVTRNILLAGTAAVALGIGLLFSYQTLIGAPKLDSRMLSALQSVQVLSAYEMQVETKTVYSDRLIAVLGLYKLNFRDNSYASLATTTLTIPENRPGHREHTFSLQNISVNNDVYVKIETDSELLKENIPHSPLWRHFTKETIPPQFNDIAVSGPVLDNLQLFSGNAKYLRLAKKPEEFLIEGSPFFRYTFELSEAASTIEGGTLKSLVARIGRGEVEVWLDATPEIRVITVKGDNYVSTTTILSVNKELRVDAPATGE